MKIKCENTNDFSAISNKQNVRSVVKKSKIASLSEEKYVSEEKPPYILDVTLKTSKDSKNSIVEGTEEQFKNNFAVYRDKFSSSSNLTTESAKIETPQGDTALEMSMILVRDLLNRHIFTEDQEKEMTERLDKYINASKYIEKGGKEAFLEYNLMFAGIAAYVNDYYTDKHAEKLISEEKYTKEEYEKVKKFAAELQNKAGVFVSVHISPGTLSYSYMGTVCSITDKELDFMADHREADEVWIKLVQGDYKNMAEVLHSLHDKGLDSVVEAYKKEFNYKDEYAISDPGFKQETGALWSQTVGYCGEGPADSEALNRLKIKYLGDKDARVKYTPGQLNKAYADGEKEFEKISDIPFLEFNKEEEEAESEKKKKQIESLKKKIKEIEKQIREIRDTSLPDEKKNKMSEKFEKEIETIQMQINELLNDLADLAKE